MNEEGLIELLKSFKKLDPDPNFLSYSRQLILDTPKRVIRRRFDFNFKYALAIGFAVLIFYIAVAGLLSPQTQVITLNDKNLVSADKIDIHLKEARYYQVAPNVIVVVLEKNGNKNK